MNSEVTLQLAQAIIALMSTLITAFLIPYIKQKTTLAQRQKLFSIVMICVQAVEQIAEAQGLKGIAKKEKVKEYLNAYGINLEGKELDAMIEASVYELGKLKAELVEGDK